MIVADENVHTDIRAALTAAGHEVLFIGSVAPGLSDAEVLALAVQRDALLLTEDHDFGELVYVRGARHTGVLLLRIEALPFHEQARLVVAILDAPGPDLHGAFSVLTPAGLR